MRFILTRKEKRRLHRRAYAAQQRDHLEVCGALFADPRRHLHLVFLRNQTGASYGFSLRYSDLREARHAATQNGWRYLGTFHSHPVGFATVKGTDLARTPLRTYTLIYDVCAKEARLWRVSKRNGRRVATEAIIEVAPDA